MASPSGSDSRSSSRRLATSSELSFSSARALPSGFCEEARHPSRIAMASFGYRGTPSPTRPTDRLQGTGSRSGTPSPPTRREHRENRAAMGVGSCRSPRHHIECSRLRARKHILRMVRVDRGRRCARVWPLVALPSLTILASSLLRGRVELREQVAQGVNLEALARLEL